MFRKEVIKSEHIFCLFSFYHSLALHTDELFCNLIRRIWWTFKFKKLRLPYWAWINFMIWCFGLEKYLSCLTGLGLILWYIGTWKGVRLSGLLYWIWNDFMIYWTWTWKIVGFHYWPQIDFIIHNTKID